MRVSLILQNFDPHFLSSQCLDFYLKSINYYNNSDLRLLYYRIEVHFLFKKSSIKTKFFSPSLFSTKGKNSITRENSYFNIKYIMLYFFFSFIQQMEKYWKKNSCSFLQMNIFNETTFVFLQIYFKQSQNIQFSQKNMQRQTEVRSQQKQYSTICSNQPSPEEEGPKPEPTLRLDEQYIRNLRDKGIKTTPYFIDGCSAELMAEKGEGFMMLYQVHIGWFLVEVSVLNVDSAAEPEGCLHQLGRGGFANVFKGQCRSQEFAFKRVKLKPFSTAPETLAHNWKKMNKILSEVALSKILATLDLCPSMDQFMGFDLITYNDALEFGMELGKPLFKLDYLDRLKAGHLAEKDLKKSLKLMHKMNLIHGDIKPENIVTCQREGSSYRFYFIDFNVSRFVRESEGERTLTEYFGTPSYSGKEMKSLLYPFRRKDKVDLYENDWQSFEITITQLKTSCYQIEYFPESSRSNFRTQKNHQIYDVFFVGRTRNRYNPEKSSKLQATIEKCLNITEIKRRLNEEIESHPFEYLYIHDYTPYIESMGKYDQAWYLRTLNLLLRHEFFKFLTFVYPDQNLRSTNLLQVLGKEPYREFCVAKHIFYYIFYRSDLKLECLISSINQLTLPEIVPYIFRNEGCLGIQKLYLIYQKILLILSIKSGQKLILSGEFSKDRHLMAISCINAYPKLKYHLMPSYSQESLSQIINLSDPSISDFEKIKHLFRNIKQVQFEQYLGTVEWNERIIRKIEQFMSTNTDPEIKIIYKILQFKYIEYPRRNIQKTAIDDEIEQLLETTPLTSCIRMYLHLCFYWLRVCFTGNKRKGNLEKKIFDALLYVHSSQTQFSVLISKFESLSYEKGQIDVMKQLSQLRSNCKKKIPFNPFNIGSLKEQSCPDQYLTKFRSFQREVRESMTQKQILILKRKCETLQVSRFLKNKCQVELDKKLLTDKKRRFDQSQVCYAQVELFYESVESSSIMKENTFHEIQWLEECFFLCQKFPQFKKKKISHLLERIQLLVKEVCLEKVDESLKVCFLCWGVSYFFKERIFLNLFLQTYSSLLNYWYLKKEKLQIKDNDIISVFLDELWKNQKAEIFVSTLSAIGYAISQVENEQTVKSLIKLLMYSTQKIQNCKTLIYETIKELNKIQQWPYHPYTVIPSLFAILLYHHKRKDLSKQILRCSQILHRINLSAGLRFKAYENICLIYYFFLNMKCGVLAQERKKKDEKTVILIKKIIQQLVILQKFQKQIMEYTKISFIFQEIGSIIEQKFAECNSKGNTRKILRYFKHLRKIWKNMKQ